MENKKRIQIDLFIVIGFLLLLANSCKKDNDNPNILKDIEGNKYKTVTIGTQTWMVENLRTTKYNDNTDIPNITDAATWRALTTPGMCTYKNTSNTDTINSFGCLYNWYTVNTNKLAPVGWHVPSDYEWTILENYLISNGFNYDGSVNGDRFSNNKIAKALASAVGWDSYNGEGAVGNTDYPAKRNATGFTAFPDPIRDWGGGFDSFGDISYWWSATERTSRNAFGRYIFYKNSNVGLSYLDKESGSYVRCVRDN
jgi:uncharacterized protein (TIGR02145 family)